MTSDLIIALAVAQDAALKAGGILRDDFHRPGGPRGSGDKALADVEAEREIRRLLLDAFPEDDYVGEETGTERRGSGNARVWLVDPNDGTSSYIKGCRGSAVSIALLDHGTPILGVVYAFAAPDDRGDLFAFAQGCGPMRRNDCPVQRAAWPECPDKNTIFLLGQDANALSEALAFLIAPARFRAVPSIAHRLALAAAGDGDVAVSVNAPGAWDYAGGHALILAMGGRLVNEHGEDVGYTPDGASSTLRCFGGAPDIVAPAAALDWNSAWGRAKSCSDA
jgi:ADP-ribosyl-[dinitrogen reductase] hydrolase